MTDKQRALLLVLCAGLDAADPCWQPEHALAALEATVVQAGPGLTSQPELLLKLATLYVQTAQSLEAASGQASATAAGLVQALSSLTPLPALPQQHPVAVWVVQRSTDMPALAAALLQQWLLAAGVQSVPTDAGWTDCALTCSVQQGEGSVAELLASIPGALVVALGLARHRQQDPALVTLVLEAVAAAVQLAPPLAALLAHEERVCDFIRLLLLGPCCECAAPKDLDAASARMLSACMQLLLALVLAASDSSTLEVLLHHVPHQVRSGQQYSHSRAIAMQLAGMH